jgi:hypothetical protein
MPLERAEEGFGGVVGMTLEGDLSIGVIQEGEYIQGPVADVLEFLETLFHGVGLHVGHQAAQDLDAGTLVKEKELARRGFVERNEGLHLREEVGVRDVQEAAGLVRLQAMALQRAVQGGLAGGGIQDGRFCFQILSCPSKRPSAHAG